MAHPKFTVIIIVNCKYLDLMVHGIEQSGLEVLERVFPIIINEDKMFTRSAVHLIPMLRVIRLMSRVYELVTWSLKV